MKSPQGKARLRLGIIGFGRVTERFHVPGLRNSSRWQVAGICDPLAQRRDLAQRILPDVPVYFDMDELQGHESLDAVLIASPPTEHVRLASQALHNGQHVLVEKPFGLSRLGARDIVSAASATSRELAAGYNRRFKASYHTIRRELAARPHEGVVAARFELGFAPDRWDAVSGYQADRNQGGGVVLDVAVHQLELIPWLFQSAIDQIRVTGDTQSEQVGHQTLFELQLSNGVLCECIARHGRTYNELLEIRTTARLYLAYPTGLFTSGPRARRGANRLVGPKNWIDRKLIRLGLLTDETAASYAGQLESFALHVLGSGAGDLATGHEAVQAHRAAEVLSQATRDPGSWARIPRG